MGTSAALLIDVPTLDFDIVQGQDLEIPIKYETEGVIDTMVNVDLKMDLRSADYAKVIDSLSLGNGRIVITAPNSFTLYFPNAVTSAYKTTTATLKYIHALEMTTAGKIYRMFQGTATLKRELVR
jgi:hypothetical protein